jgi:hypothetical protein
MLTSLLFPRAIAFLNAAANLLAFADSAIASEREIADLA